MNAHYRLYIKSVIRLAATLLIKSSSEAESINQRLIQKRIAVDETDPTTWKYYQNLAGRYHSSDAPMTIVSHDTFEEIQFTKENLLIHRGTRRAYTYGTPYYKDLVERFPAQRALIDGILNPIDINSAIAAKDHTILFYDKTLVEPSEQYLIPSLQQFVNVYFSRYNNPDYALFEPYYLTALYGILYTKLVSVILTLRKEACKTDQAHSFHIRQYLLSFSQVGREFDFMTHKQRLYLYRNIRYLNLNLGRKEIFDEVTQKILTDRGFSLVGYNISHNYETLTEDLKPKIEMVRETLNGINPAMGGQVETLRDIFAKENPLTKANPEFMEQSLDQLTLTMQHSLSSKLPTKVLESNVVDLTDAEPFTLTEVLLNHWIYLSHYDRYTTVITFVNPSNGDSYRLSAKDAFIFFLYAFNRGNDVELKQVPVISANRVRRIPLPTWDELRHLADKKKVPDYYIDYILDTQIPIGRYVSVDAFREVCIDIQRLMLSHRDMRHYNPDYKAEGDLHVIVDRCYQDIRIDLAGEMDYDLWLEEKGINVAGMGRLEFSTMAASILSTVTGQDLTVTNSMRAVHSAMIRIMKALSSYTVQYLAEINDSPLKVIDGKFPKLTIPHHISNAVHEIETPNPTIIEQKNVERSSVKVELPALVGEHKIVEQSTVHKIPVQLDIRVVNVGGTSQPIEVVAPVFTRIIPGLVDLALFDQDQDDVSGYLDIPTQPIDDWIQPQSLTAGYGLLSEERRRMLLRI